MEVDHSTETGKTNTRVNMMDIITYGIAGIIVLFTAVFLFAIHSERDDY